MTSAVTTSMYLFPSSITVLWHSIRPHPISQILGCVSGNIIQGNGQLLQDCVSVVYLLIQSECGAELCMKVRTWITFAITPMSPVGVKRQVAACEWSLSEITLMNQARPTGVHNLF